LRGGRVRWASVPRRSKARVPTALSRLERTRRAARSVDRHESDRESPQSVAGSGRLRGAAAGGLCGPGHLLPGGAPDRCGLQPLRLHPARCGWDLVGPAGRLARYPPGRHVAVFPGPGHGGGAPLVRPGAGRVLRGRRVCDRRSDRTGLGRAARRAAVGGEVSALDRGLPGGRFRLQRRPDIVREQPPRPHARLPSRTNGRDVHLGHRDGGARSRPRARART
jgi:hypothetical protein